MKRWIGLFLALIVMLLACTASATLDPARADADAVSASADHRPFCAHPMDFSPGGSSHRLCAYSHQIPDCQAYADECDRLEPKPPAPLPAWLISILKGIVEAIAFITKRLGLVGIWLIAAIVLALVLYPIVQAIAQSRRDAKVVDPLALLGMPLKKNAETLTLSRDDDPARVLEEADLLARQGKLDHALYRYLHAALLSLDKKGAIVIARETTHGEYVRACNDSEAKPPLRDLVREIDLVRFGGREASPTGVEKAQERATWIVRRALAAAVMLIAFVCAGCGSQPLSGNDPAGSDTLRALLEKQNIEVKTLPQSLSRVPIPTPANRESTPAIYVDVDRIPLEAEAQEHLLRWVDAGGILVLAGSPAAWPSELKAKIEKTKSLKISVTTFPNDTDSDSSSDADDQTEPEPRIDHGTLANPIAVSWVDPQTFVLASTDGDEKDFAVGRIRGAGAIYGIASDDIFTNAGLAIPGNPGAAIAILANIPRQKYLFAPVGAGYSPPTNPFSGLINAGLGLPLIHGLFATIILFFAVGMRLAAPSPDAPPQRRAFTEHIYATAAVYNRTRSAKHALASFGRYAETRLSRKLHRSAPDIVTLLSQRSGESIEECAHLWNRAMVAREGENDPPNGDELKILGRLTSIYARTMQ